MDSDLFALAFANPLLPKMQENRSESEPDRTNGQEFAYGLGLPPG
jgi:hypothetical protein